MGDQVFDHDAATPSFSVTGPNGYKEFFNVFSAIENDVTCQLLADDCSSALVGT